jgi:hypothetical protein
MTVHCMLMPVLARGTVRTLDHEKNNSAVSRFPTLVGVALCFRQAEGYIPEGHWCRMLRTPVVYRILVLFYHDPS